MNSIENQIKYHKQRENHYINILFRYVRKNFYEPVWKFKANNPKTFLAIKLGINLCISYVSYKLIMNYIDTIKHYKNKFVSSMLSLVNYTADKGKAAYNTVTTNEHLNKTYNEFIDKHWEESSQLIGIDSLKDDRSWFTRLFDKRNSAKYVADKIGSDPLLHVDKTFRQLGGMEKTGMKNYYVVLKMKMKVS
jgi:hypothetical protein